MTEQATVPSVVLRNLILVCMGLTAAVVAQTMLLLSVPLRALELGATTATVGFVVSAPYLLPLLFAIPLGGAVTKLGAQKMFGLGALGMVAGPMVSLLFDHLLALVLTQLMIGLSHVMLVISAQSVVAGLGRGKKLEQYFGWYTMFISGGQLLGPLLAGVLIDRFSMALTFSVIGLIPIISITCSLFLQGDAKRGIVTNQPKGYRAQIQIVRTNKGMQLSMLASSAALFAVGAHMAFMPVYLDTLAFSATTIGILISLRALSAMTIRPFMTQVIDLLGRRSTTFIVCVACVGVGLSFAGFTSSPWLLALLAILVGLGSGLSQPLSVVALAEHVPAEQRASALGMRLTANRGSQLMAPIFLGLMAEGFGFHWAFLMAGLGILSACWFLIRMAPSYDQLEAAQPARK